MRERLRVVRARLLIVMSEFLWLDSEDIVPSGADYELLPVSVELARVHQLWIRADARSVLVRSIVTGRPEPVIHPIPGGAFNTFPSTIDSADALKKWIAEDAGELRPMPSLSVLIHGGELMRVGIHALESCRFRGALEIQKPQFPPRAPWSN